MPTSLLSARRFLRRDKRLLSFSFFLLISIALWTLNKLSHSYIYDLPAQIELVTPTPVNYMITTSTVTPTQLRVRALGYDIMRYKFFDNKTFKVPITPAINSSKSDITSSVATAQLRNTVAQQLGTGYELQVILPDSISIQLSRMAAKKVPVRSNFRITYAPQYMQRGDVEFKPDSVVVSGAESALALITEIYTERTQKDRVSADLSGKADLIVPSGTIVSHRKVMYNVDVQRFIEISYNLPILVAGAPDSLNVELLPNTAKVTFSVTMEEYPQLKREELYLIASYRELRKSMSGQVRVSLNKPPKYTLSTTISPAFVSVVSKHK